MLVLFSLLLIVLVWRVYIFLKNVKSKNVPVQQRTRIKALLWGGLLAAGIVVPKLISVFAFNGLPWSMIFIWGPDLFVIWRRFMVCCSLPPVYSV
ncbi:hypothetical protein QO179_08220 [Bacillus stercoris]|nr:hypothetical protein [Bacillus stercoris]